MTATTTVTSPNGDRWTVTYLPGQQRARTGLGNASGRDASRAVAGILRALSDDGATVRCAACGVRCGIGRGLVRDGWSIAAAEGDRAVGDLPGWTVDGPGVPYCAATVVPVCPVHNGDSRARAALSDDERRALERAARRALERYGDRAP